MEPVNCPLSGLSFNSRENSFSSQGSSSICQGMQEAWGKGFSGSSGLTPLLRAMVGTGTHRKDLIE